jgi:RNA polymerase sigma-70 factor (ECF subfamily)
MPTAAVTSREDMLVVEALRQGDERMFEVLVDRYHATLIRLARMYVRDRAVAEEVVQETWLGVLNGLDRFEARSSLKTWIFRILTNRAKTRGQREARSVPFSALADPEERERPSVDPGRFRGVDEVSTGTGARRPVRGPTCPRNS